MIFGKKSSVDAEKLEAQIELMGTQNKLLLGALTFYADPNNWEVGYKYLDADDATIFTDGSHSAVTADAGKKALRILNKIKKG